MSAPDYTPLILPLIVTGLIGILATAFTAQQNRKQDKEKARHAYIDRTVSQLIDLRGELQFHQVQGWYDIVDEARRKEIIKKYGEPTAENQKAMEIAFGKTYAIMISVAIEEIRTKAPVVMDDVDPSVKLKAINEALEILGKEYGFFNQEKNPADWRYENA